MVILSEGDDCSCSGEVIFVAFLQSEPEEVTEYSEALVRRMIEKISVYDDHFVVEFKSGIEITINE